MGSWQTALVLFASIATFLVAVQTLRGDEPDIALTLDYISNIALVGLEDYDTQIHSPFRIPKTMRELQNSASDLPSVALMLKYYEHYSGGTELSAEPSSHAKRLVVKRSRNWSLEDTHEEEHASISEDREISIDFSRLDYYSINYRNATNTFSPLEEISAPYGGIVFHYPGAQHSESVYKVSFASIEGRSFPCKSTGTADGDDGYISQYGKNLNTYDNRKDSVTNIALTVREEKDAIKLVNALRHAVKMAHGGKIPPPVKRKSKMVQPDHTQERDPFDHPIDQPK